MTPFLLISIATGVTLMSESDQFDVLISPLSDLPGVSVRTYGVSGRSARSVRESIDWLRPVETSTRERHDAITEWSYVPNWTKSSDEKCLASSATVSVSIQIAIPRLLTRNQLWPSERADWDRYFVVLVGHERNHARLALAGGIRMQAALRKAATCDEMNLIVQRTNAEVREASDAYDYTTDHGALEGATFPSHQP